MVKFSAKGFTLIELMVVMVILSLLVTIAVGIFTNTQRNARDSRRKADLEAVRLALEQYRTVNGSYPNGPTCKDTQSDNVSNWTLSSCNLTGYMKELPKDPLNTASGSENYLYKYCSDAVAGASASAFVVTANLENEAGSGTPPITCSVTGTKNYWVRSQQ